MINDTDMNKITPEHLDATIYGAQFWQPEGTTLTICAMRLNNVTIVVGKSACIDPDIFDAEIGKQIAYDDAREKIWEKLNDKLTNNL